MVKAHLELPWSSHATGALCQSWQCTMSGLQGEARGGRRRWGRIRRAGVVHSKPRAGVHSGRVGAAGWAALRALWVGCGQVGVRRECARVDMGVQERTGAGCARERERPCRREAATVGWDPGQQPASLQGCRAAWLPHAAAELAKAEPTPQPRPQKQPRSSRRHHCGSSVTGNPPHSLARVGVVLDVLQRAAAPIVEALAVLPDVGVDLAHLL